MRDVRHLRCHRVRERDVVFDSHTSGFVYKVQVDGQVLIKKEIPGPDTINEFIYEINALHSLQYSSSVIDFFGVVVDDEDEHIKGLLISYAEQGTLVDIIYDHQPGNEKGLLPLPWTTRAMWARQIVQGLADVHESGFVQGDFTLSNIVVDGAGNAKIIDINRRGCPVGWEPPESRPLIKSSQGISMYIGVKSDLYQLGMVLWSLAMEDDEPEKYGPGLALGADVDVPPWYRKLVDICLSDDPRMRIQASSLLSLFPAGLSTNDVTLHTGSGPHGGHRSQLHPHPPEGCQMNEQPRVRTVSPSDRFSHDDFTAFLDTRSAHCESPYPYPTRGRSPPSPLPSNSGQHDTPGAHFSSSWTFSGKKASYSDCGLEDRQESGTKTATEGSPGPRAPECEGSRSPRGTPCGMGMGSRRGDGRRASSHPATLDKADEDPELRKEGRAVTPQDGSQAENTANSNEAILSEKPTDAKQNVTPQPTENVGESEGANWSFAGGLGIMSETGITGPYDLTGGESQHMPSANPLRVDMSQDRVDPSGRTERDMAKPNMDSARPLPASPIEHGTDYTHARAIREDSVGVSPQPFLACGNEIARSDACEKPGSGRTSDGAISIVTGVRGADDDCPGDLTQFPTSLEDEPELMTVPTRMATMISVPRGPNESISSPIFVGY